MGMEDDTRDFLVAIVQTVSLVVLWMMLNVLLGIWFGLGLFEDRPSLKNYIYYVAFLASMYFLIRHLIKKWEKVKKF